MAGSLVGSLRLGVVLLYGRFLPLAVRLITIQEATAVAESTRRKMNQGSRSGLTRGVSGLGSRTSRSRGRVFQGLSRLNQRERKRPERPKVAIPRITINNQTRGSATSPHVPSDDTRSNMVSCPADAKTSVEEA
jgi:hypothetical protein